MINGKTLRDAILSGANNISNQRTRVDELNVFPVPDGDTGTNMSMTIGAATQELAALPDSCTVGEARKVAASAMLRGARGNSGVITSLLFRGFSKALQGKQNAEAADLAKALQMGVEAAYKAVMKPTEGTILTVTRLAAEAAVASTATEVPALWAEVMTAGQAALEDTPNLLPVLKKAGVVDAGGQGILLAVIEVSRHGDDRLGDLLAQVGFGVRLQLGEDHRADLFGGVVLAAGMDLLGGAHLPLDGGDGVFRVGDGLTLGDLAHQTLAGLGEAHHRRGGAGAFGIGDHDGLAAFHDGDAAVGRAKVDTNDLTHTIKLPSCTFPAPPVQGWSCSCG